MAKEKHYLTENAKLMAEWDWEKNAKSPDQYTLGSGQKVWWKCENNHSWQATVYDRANGTKCPLCSKQNRTSLAEQAVYYYIHKRYEEAINGYKDIFPNSMELDIFIPTLKIGIEYDGQAWHNTKAAYEREKRKYNICKDMGICLYRIKENVNDTKTDTADVVLYVKETIDETIKQLLNYDLVLDDINFERDRNAIFEQYKSILKNHSLEHDYPEISKEWHPTKNGNLKPNMFASKSSQKAWWKCASGHEWYASIAQRTFLNRSCPYCSNQKVLKGYNDFETLCPEIAKQWHPTNNHILSPSDVTIGSGKIVWWICPEGHEWKASVKSRVKGSGCPVCAGKIPIVGKTDLETVFPNIAKEWNYKLNGDLTPKDIPPHSGKKYWWICENNHSWLASVDNRVKGRGCPYCSNKAVLKGYNDLQTRFPEIAEEWHPTKNDDLTPDNFVFGSAKKAWWKCKKCGHEWQASICTRTKGHGCPACARSKHCRKKQLKSQKR